MQHLKIIAQVHSDFTEKFGIPRQSGVVEGLRAKVVFEPEYRNPDALRGLEEFSHIWLLWGFSEAERDGWSPTVRPPRLGGNKRLGVFTTRAPYRPNALGLSCVQLESIEQTPDAGAILNILGGDLMDGTPVYDIKPYLPYADCHPEATGGFAAEAPTAKLAVTDENALLAQLPEGKREALKAVLALDPRPGYQKDDTREYGMAFAGYEVKFTVTNNTLHIVGFTPSK